MLFDLVVAFLHLWAHQGRYRTCGGEDNRCFIGYLIYFLTFKLLVLLISVFCLVVDLLGMLYCREIMSFIVLELVITACNEYFSLFFSEAARECRRKKKEYVRCLENRVALLENQNKTLISELKSLKELYCQKGPHNWAHMTLNCARSMQRRTISFTCVLRPHTVRRVDAWAGSCSNLGLRSCCVKILYWSLLCGCWMLFGCWLRYGVWFHSGFLLRFSEWMMEQS